MKKLRARWQFFLVPAGYLAVAALVYRRLLLAPGYVGFRHDWGPLPFLAEQYNQLPVKDLYIWVRTYTALGQPSLFPTEYPERILLSFLGSWVGGEVITKGYLIGTAVLAGSLLYGLCRHLRLSRSTAFVAGLFYMLTPYVFDSAVAGHTPLMLGYSLLPLVLLSYMKLTESERLNWPLIGATSLLIVLASTAIQFLVLSFATCFLYCLFAPGLRKFWHSFKVLLILLSLVLLMESTSLAGVGFQLQNALSMAGGGGEASTGFLRFASVPLVRRFALTGLWTSADYFLDALPGGLVPADWGVALLYLSPLLAFTALVLRPRDRVVLFFGALTLLSLFLSKGVAPPFGEFFLWIYQRFPPIRMFRHVSRILPPAALGLAMLLGFGLDALRERLKWRDQKVSVAFSGLAIAVVVLGLQPWFIGGDLSGQLQQVKPVAEYQVAYRSLAREAGDFRILWVPMSQPFSYAYSEFAGMDPLILYPPKPTVGNVTQGKLPSFLDYGMRLARTDIKRLLDLANIGYVIYRDDYRSKLTEFTTVGYDPSVSKALWTNWRLMQVLGDDEELKLVHSLGPLQVYENQHFLPHIFASGNMALVSGGALTLLTDKANVLEGDLGRGGDVVFAPQLSSADSPYTDRIESVVVVDGEYLDLQSAFVPDQYRLDPAAVTKEVQDANEGWVDIDRDWGSWWYYNVNYLAAPESAALSKTAATLPMSFSLEEPGDYEVWAKVYKGTKGSGLVFELDGERLGQVETKSPIDEGFRWIHLGSVDLLPGSHQLEVVSHGGENVLARALVVPAAEWQAASAKAQSLLDTKELILIHRPQGQSDDGLNPGRVEINQPGPYLIPRTAGYEIKVGFVDVPGVREKMPPSITLRVDGERLIAHQQPGQPAQEVDWYAVPNVTLSAGEHAIEVVAPPEGPYPSVIKMATHSELAEQEAVSPGLVHEEVNPTRYRVQVTDARAPYHLVFSESFAPGWEAYVRESPEDTRDEFAWSALLSQLWRHWKGVRRSKLDDHLQVNGYANGWYVDREGSYTIDVEYRFQPAYEIALLVTGATLAVCAILALGVVTRRLARST